MTQMGIAWQMILCTKVCSCYHLKQSAYSTPTYWQGNDSHTLVANFAEINNLPNPTFVIIFSKYQSIIIYLFVCDYYSIAILFVGQLGY